LGLLPKSHFSLLISIIGRTEHKSRSNCRRIIRSPGRRTTAGRQRGILPPSCHWGSRGVIHIGFLSTIKTPSPDRNISPHENTRGLSVWFRCRLFCRVTSNVPKRPGEVRGSGLAIVLIRAHSLLACSNTSRPPCIRGTGHPISGPSGSSVLRPQHRGTSHAALEDTEKKRGGSGAKLDGAVSVPGLGSPNAISRVWGPLAAIARTFPTGGKRRFMAEKISDRP